MIINKNTYDELLHSIKPYPPETGGILGGKNKVVSEFFLDDGIPSQRICSYYPAVKALNKKIKEWQLRNIDFLGMFHLHFYDVDTLSKGDREYILKIMKHMPQKIDELFFPIIVLPKYEMVSYAAKKISGEYFITKDVVYVKELDHE